MKILYFISIIIFLTLQYSLFFSQNSVISYFYLKDKLEKNQLVLSNYADKNKIVEAEIYNIKSNKKYLEIYAREKFGLIKKNETFFQIIKNDKKDN
tara:strand:+ start:395 stop:682 length:288 start_codon:yes stop_codon:yes gene_type:complete